MQSMTTDAQFVTLGIDREIFAVPVENVVEILEMRQMFRLPDAPAYLAGLIDVRGRSIPVIDLRQRFGLVAVAATDATRIMVLEMAAEDRRLTIGLIADRVFEVAPLDDFKMEPPPDIGERWRSDYISGVGRRGERFVVVINLHRLFAPGDVALRGADAMSAVFAAP